MRRRDFLAFASTGALFALSGRAHAQQTPLVGFLRNSSRHDSEFRLTAFREGLAEAGFVDGRNVAIKALWGDSVYDRLPALAAELVKLNVAVLATSGNASTLAAKAATSTIPIVFAVGNDPVEMGLVPALNRPGGNLTGVSFVTTLIGKRLELMQELTSKQAPFVYLQDVNNPAGELEAHELEIARRAISNPVTVIKVHGDGDLEPAFAEMKRQGIAAVILAAGTFSFRWGDQLAALALRYKLPAIFAGDELVRIGGLMSYSGSQSEAHRLAGRYCGRILKGAKPSELPVVLPTTFDLIINLKTAKAMGLEIPPAMLARANAVVE